MVAAAVAAFPLRIGTKGRAVDAPVSRNLCQLRLNLDGHDLVAVLGDDTAFRGVGSQIHRICGLTVRTCNPAAESAYQAHTLGSTTYVGGLDSNVFVAEPGEARLGLIARNAGQSNGSCRGILRATDYA